MTQVRFRLGLGYIKSKREAEFNAYSDIQSKIEQRKCNDRTTKEMRIKKKIT